MISHAVTYKVTALFFVLILRGKALVRQLLGLSCCMFVMQKPFLLSSVSAAFRRLFPFS